MANDHIPRPDAPFYAWQNNFVTYVNGHLAGLVLAPGDVVDPTDSAATSTTASGPRSAQDAVRSCWTKHNQWKIKGSVRP